MSSASPQVINYLQQQLSRNPVNESSDIISLRARTLKLDEDGKSIAPQSSDRTDERQALKAKLERIRSQCFTTPVPELKKQLGRLHLEDHPHFAALASRLKVVLECRNRLPTLSADPRFDGDFFSCLKKVLVEPARDVAVLREQVLHAFRDRKMRKRGQDMIRLVEEELPELYALEHDWLESLLRFTSRSAVAAGHSSARTNDDSNSTPWPVWVIMLLIAIPLMRGIALMWETNPPPDQQRSEPVDIKTPQQMREERAEFDRQHEQNIREFREQIRQTRLRWEQEEREREQKRREEFTEGMDAESRAFFEKAWKRDDEFMKRASLPFGTEDKTHEQDGKGGLSREEFLKGLSEDRRQFWQRVWKEQDERLKDKES